MTSLYLHIPFCRHRCSYCDFNTYTTIDDLRPRYTDALANEIYHITHKHKCGEKISVKTIFFGGGTPSLMTISEMDTIFSAIYTTFDVQSDAEVTIEANPNTVTEEYLRELRKLGVNRLSFGVQSVHADELKLLDRIHDFSTVQDAVGMARRAGFDNFNLDLIYGVPGQTVTSWEKSIESCLALDPAHISLYCLTLEPGTPLKRSADKGVFPLPDPDLAADQYELACKKMAEVGFVHYEISNWSKPNKECQHNLVYWRNEEYLAFGAGAHGHANDHRYHIVRQPRVYIRRMEAENPESTEYPFTPALAEKTKLSIEDQIHDTVITQLRLLHEGLGLAQFKEKFGISFEEKYPEKLPMLIEWGLLKIENGRLLLTEKGWFLSNQVFHRLL